MEILYLSLACLLFSVQFIFSKAFQTRSAGGYAVGIWRSVVVSLAMLCYLIPMTGLPFSVTPTAWGYSIVYTLINFLGTAVLVPALKLGSLSITTTYCLLGGMILPFLYGILFLHEALTVTKCVGIALLTLSLLPALLHREDDGEQQAAAQSTFLRKHLLFHGLCIIIFLTNGMGSCIAKAHQISPDAIDTNCFLALTTIQNALLSLLILTAIAIFWRAHGRKDAFRGAFWEIGLEKMSGKLMLILVLCCAAYSACNGVGNLFSFQCAKTMDSSIQFPIISAAVIVLTAFFGRIFFKEKIHRSDWIRLILSMAGILVFMF